MDRQNLKTVGVDNIIIYIYIYIYLIYNIYLFYIYYIYYYVKYIIHNTCNADTGLSGFFLYIYICSKITFAKQKISLSLNIIET